MFITLEGIEGSGKSTQTLFLAGLLEAKGWECVVTREPGGTEIGKRIRAVLLDPASREVHPHTELLLYVADRCQHLRERILPALEGGKAVVCDRFQDATLAYQGVARGLGSRLVEDLHRMLLDDVRPDLTLLFDLTPAEGLARAWRQIDGGARPAGESRFESEALAFHGRVRDAYLALARAEPGRFRRIDAAASIPEVEAQIRRIVEDSVPARPGGAAPDPFA